MPLVYGKEVTSKSNHSKMNLASSLIFLLAVSNAAESRLRNNLEGRHLTCIMSHVPPLTLLNRNSTGQIVAFSGQIVEIFEWLSKRLHFTYTIVPVLEISIGKLVNGSWTGSIGQIQRNEYDVALGPYSPTHERHSALDFVAYVGVGRNWLLLKYPESRLSDSAVFEPYNWSLWILWLFSMVALGTTGLLMVYMREKQFLAPSSRFRRVDAMIMYLFGTMSGQGGYYRTGHQSIGFIALFWCLTAFFFIYIYNSILTSRLSAHYQYPEIKSLDDLANNPTYELATLRGSIWEADFLSAKKGALGILGDRYRKCSNCSIPTVEALGRKPLEGNYISFMSYTYAAGVMDQDFRETRKCRLTFGNINYGWQYTFLAIRRNSPFMEEFHRESLWAKAYGFSSTSTNWPGISFKIPEQCVLKYNTRGVSVQQYNVPIKLFQLFPAFMLLIAGHASALLQFLIELLCIFRQRTTRKIEPKLSSKK